MIGRLDHLVLTVGDVGVSARFYSEVLGLRAQTFGEGRTALVGDGWKINLHPASAPIVPHASRPTPGSADLCFLLDVPLADAITRLGDLGVPVEAGPVRRTGSRGPIVSAYLRDPDGNLVELAEPVA